ncbi:MAG: siderophore-interacting protein [Phenylobacterium sp.]|uniref:siderophore-interacting protein n=1 Tax=Phenylobacterium sp. TaxID=1871053 RepID=UPI001B5AD55E|nr:siderophore-interacting protein [Phenylobacterium sp.]MBP7650209.1 siderophore-interacting protein [Phenylobacterium sp.]MBP7816713.1 siderophore-interacting protein [Phenylobacterium sp.]MBP9753860.1 siderophore-interacting protein [Phenylobacterium sp.]
MPDAFPAARPMKPPMPVWTLTVTEARDVTPHMRRVSFALENAQGFEHQPGQDLVLIMTGDDGQPGRRHYTVRAVDREAGSLDIDFVLHGHGGPAERWALSAKPGDTLKARGPRGRTIIYPGADWRLFVGDETCLPGIFAMIESLPATAKAFAFLEVADKADQQPLNAICDVELEWLVRGGPAEPGSRRLIDRLALFAPRPGRGHAYVIGETSTVRTQRQSLIARGFDKSQISAEGYWRRGRQGGHDHIFDEAEMAARMGTRG